MIATLSGRLPLMDELFRRVIKLNFKCINSANEVVKCVCLIAKSKLRVLRVITGVI
jgi:hypothetical protein